MTKLLICMFVFCIYGGYGIQIDKLDVPTKVEVGASASLKCYFNKEGKDIIIIAWYLNDQQFYMYKPWYFKPMNVFHLKNDPLCVNKEKSDMHTVSIYNITVKAKGFYMCEIITGPPNFVKAKKSAWMDVTVTNYGTSSFLFVFHSLIYNSILLNMIT